MKGWSRGMNEVVIVGAGQTGRGFINRFVQASGQRTVFIDKDADLVRRLNEQGRYMVSYGPDGPGAVTLDNYRAVCSSDPDALDAISHADIVFVSVGGGNLPDVCDLLDKAFVRCAKHRDVVTAENGVKVSAALSRLEERHGATVAEAIVFCTTLAQDGSLDILSEDLSYLPYDRSALDHDLAIARLTPETHLDVLMQRKIYTYNCISAVIAYLGAYKGYEVYSDAAHDACISAAVDAVAAALNPCIAERYDVALPEQIEFSRMAIAKFGNRSIADTVERNVRDPERKLAKGERLMAPLRILAEHGGECRALLAAVAAAIWYGERQSCLSAPVESYLGDLPSDWVAVATGLLSGMRAGEDLSLLLQGQ